MPRNLTVNGTAYSVPTSNDLDWGSNLNTWMAAASDALNVPLATILDATDPRYGCKGDGVTDDTANLQAALNLAIAGNRLLTANGTLLISDTILINNCYGFSWRGLGAFGFKLKWAGASGKPMVKVRNSQYVHLDNIQFIGNSNAGNKPSYFIESSSDTSVSRMYVPRGLHLSNLDLGSGTGQATDGMGWTNTGGSSDTNNDFGVIERVRCYNTVTRAAASIGHTQSVEHQFINCDLSGGQYGITNALGTGGGYRVRGGSIGSQSVSALQIIPTGAQTAFSIEKVNCEGANRFLTGNGTNNNGNPIDIRSVRFACDGLNADNRWIQLQSAGPLTVEGCNFDSGNPPRIYINNGGANSISVAVRNCSYAMVSSDTVDPIEFSAASNGYYRLEVSGNIGRTAGDVAREIASYVKTSGGVLGERVAVPSTASSTGTTGQWAVDSSYRYECVGTNTWVRTALATW